MDLGKIRNPGLTVTVLPPREGFSAQAVGAVGLLVHRTFQPGDVVIGQPCDAPFPERCHVPVPKMLWPPFGRTERYFAGVLKLLRRLRPALIEVHNRANLALAIADALPGARLALFLHNDPQAMRGAKTPAQRASLARRMTIVCPSAWLRDRFLAGLDPATPAPTLLPNTLDLAALPPPLPPHAREPTMLFVGRLVADKGADAFVHAWARISGQLPGWRAVMIGADRFHPHSPETAFIRRLRRDARAAGVDIQGYRPHARVMEAMARAAIVAVPSRWAEPFGLAALEAMASGAALICGTRGGLPELAGGAAWLADPDAPGALEDAMLSLATDPGRRAGQAMAGLARAREYDLPACAARLLALRARLLGARGC